MRRGALNRNSTNFPVQLFDTLRAASAKDQPLQAAEYGFLKYYQNLVRWYLTEVEVGAKGLLVYQTMGLGKSILAIAIAMELMKERQPIMLLSKSLQNNMRKSIVKYVSLRREYDTDWPIGRLPEEELDRWIDINFAFVSLNAGNLLTQMNKAADAGATADFDAALDQKFGELTSLASLDGKLLLVDEAHNLFRAITNGSKNAKGVYDMVMSSDVKVVFFTGTPIASDPFELVPCFNMLSGVSGRDTTLLPESYREFYKLYVDSETNRCKNKERFQNRIMGLVSYVSRDSIPGAVFDISKVPIRDEKSSLEFPTEEDLKVVKVRMYGSQYVTYQLARDKEKEESERSFGQRGGDNLTKPKSVATSTYRVKTRQLSNFGQYAAAEPVSIEGRPRWASPKYEAIVENLSPGKLAVVCSQFTGDGGLGSFEKYLLEIGWQKVEPPKMGGWRDEPNPMIEYLRGLDKSTQQHTNCTKGSILTDSIEGSASPATSAPKFAVATGDMDADIRGQIAAMFNEPDNMRGEKIALLLLSGAGAEGTDLKNVRSVHIMEPAWNWGRITQIIARGVRAGSHIALPPEDRTCAPFIYLAIQPQEYDSTDDIDATSTVTTDVELFDKSRREYALDDSFHQALQEVSIECLANAGTSCRKCAPTDQTLYTDDPARDILMEDPCTELVEEEISAVGIVYNGVEYYYVPNERALYNYDVFMSAEGSGWRKMPESHPIYALVCAEIGRA